MGNIKTRLAKLEARQRAQLPAWLKLATDEELDTRIRELVAKWKGCKPAEVNLSPENRKIIMATLKAELCQDRVGYAKN